MLTYPLGDAPYLWLRRLLPSQAEALIRASEEFRDPPRRLWLGIMEELEEQVLGPSPAMDVLGNLYDVVVSRKVGATSSSARAAVAWLEDEVVCPQCGGPLTVAFSPALRTKVVRCSRLPDFHGPRPYVDRSGEVPEIKGPERRLVDPGVLLNPSVKTELDRVSYEAAVEIPPEKSNLYYESNRVSHGARAYACLLNLRGDEHGPPFSLALHEVANRLIRAARSADLACAEEQAVDFLSGSGWRGQLLALVWSLALPSRPHIVEALWRAFDGRSWVSPQIAVTLYFHDPDFPHQSATRLRSLSKPSFAGTDPSRPPVGILHHVADRHGWVPNDPKGYAALLKMAEKVAELGGEIFDFRLTRAGRELEAKDIDEGGAIAERWFEKIRRLFREGGIELTPAFLG